MQKKSLCADDLQDGKVKTIEKYSSMVYRLAFSLVKSKSDADDIHQEVFVRYIVNGPVFQSTEHEKAWFLRVTANLCKNWWRSAWKRKVVSLTEFVGYDVDSASHESEYDGVDVGSVEGIHGQHDSAVESTVGCEEGVNNGLVAAVKKLPQKYRAVIHLFYYEEMSVEEIAGVLNLKPSTVRTQLTRARRKLKEMLEEDV